MNYELRKRGLTMVEMMIAIGLVAMLAAAFFVVGGRVRTQAQIQTTKTLLATLDTALQQYYDATHAYPPDCNSYLNGSTRYVTKSISNIHQYCPGFNYVAGPPTRLTITNETETFGSVMETLSSAAYKDQRYFSIAVAYYYLNCVPQSRQILAKLGDSNDVMRTDGVRTTRRLQINVTVNKAVPLPSDILRKYPFFRILDPWGRPLRYSWPGNDGKNFPKVESAGPDKTFDTADDIVNRKN